MTKTLSATSASDPPRSSSKLRLGLCCQFVGQPISFRTTTAASLLRMKPADQQLKLSRLCLTNAESLLLALQYCADNDIGSFRIGSAILPIKTHPQVGYLVDELPDAEVIIAAFRCCGTVAAEPVSAPFFIPISSSC